MQRRLCRLAILLCLLLVAAGVLVLRPAPERAVEVDSASLGLMLQEADGAVCVLAVSPRSAAEQAGLRPGDRILRAGVTPLTSAALFSDLLDDGEELPLTIWRDERELRLTLPCR